MTRFAARARLASGISALALAASAFGPSVATAQTLSNLQGRVQGAGPGAVVTATDRNTGQRLTGKVGADGVYTILGLRAGTYRVEVTGKPAQDVVVPVGQTIVADFTEAAAPAASASGVSEVVVVARRSSQQDVRTATVNTNITQAQIENLPQNDRNFLNFAALAPGVTVTPSAGARQFSAGAVSSSQTNVFVDGLSLKNPVNHGGIVGQNFSLGNPFPQDAIQEFAVNTQNFKAEYEQAGSALITSQTKSGGTEFHGDAFAEFQPKSFLGQPHYDRNNPKPDYDRKQYGGSIGGPIIKDKLHFFFAYEGTDQSLPSQLVNLNNGATDRVPASIASQYNKSYAQSFSQQLIFGKLTWFATPSDTVDFSVFDRNEDNLSDYGGNAVPSHGHDLQSAVRQYQLKWNHRAGQWLNEFTAGYNEATNGTPRVTSGPEIALERQANNNGALTYDNGTGTCGTAVSNIPCVATGNEDALLGANSFFQNDTQKITTFQNYTTFFAGKHIIKGGVKLNFTALSRTEDLASNGSYYFLDSAYTDFAGSTPFAAKVSTLDVKPASANDTQIGLFIQDDWSPDEHWTVNAGIRYDYETNAKNENFRTPDAIAAQLRSYAGWKAAGINPEDYISTGGNRKPVTDAFQPRLGVSYDVWGDHDLIVYAGAGRYYDRPLFIESAIETTKDVYQSAPTVNFCNPTGGAYTTLSPCSAHTNNPAYLAYNPSLKDVTALRSAVTATGLGGDVWLLNNKTKLPYTDQLDIGVRKRLGPFNASIALSYQKSHNLFMFVRGNRLPSGNYTDAAPGPIGNQDTWVDDTVPPEGQLPGHSGKLNIGSNAGVAEYKAIYFTFEKPFNKFSRWGSSNTLTISEARTNIAQELGSDELFNGSRLDAYGTNRVAGSEKWRYVGTLIGRGPWDTIASANLTLSSGPSFGSVIFGLPNTPATACCYADFHGLQYSKDFVGYKQLDIRVAKTFKLWHGQEVTADFQVYNIFDWVNRSYSAWGAGSRSYDAATGTISAPSKIEYSTVGNARSFQAGVRYAF